MAAACIFIALLVSIPEMSRATYCDGSDPSCIPVQANAKSLLQRSLSNKSVVMARGVRYRSDACKDFMDPDDSGQIAPWKSMYTAATVTSVQVIKAAVQQASKVAATAFGFTGLFALSVVGKVLVPDPKEERLQNLENGMSCLMTAVSDLQKEVTDLQKKFGGLSELAKLDSTVPLKEISTALTLQAEEHMECEKLMKCVADVKFMKDKQYDVSWCEEYMLNEFNINKIVKNCDSAAFQEKFVEHDHYHEIRKDVSHLTTYVKTIIELSLEDMYPAAHLILAEYTAVATDLYLAWTSMEGWAAAICHPKTKCTKKDKSNIKRGLSEFEKDKQFFVDKFVQFRDELNETSFMKKREENLITMHLSSKKGCSTKKIDTHKKQTIGGTQLSWQKTYVRDEYGLSCSEKDLKKEYCGADPCIITLSDPPFGCQQKNCDDWSTKKCVEKTVHNFDCPKCGILNLADCDNTWTFKLQYDHLAEQMEYVDIISGALSERSVIEPPDYKFAKGSSYLLSSYFCEKLKIKKKKKKNNCNK